MFPDLKIIGEEGSLDIDEKKDIVVARQGLMTFCADSIPDNIRELSISDTCIFIDPLDGTKEYTLGHVESVTVLIGIAYKTRSLAGVVHIPFVNRTLIGIIGVGTFEMSPSGQITSLPPPKSLPENVIVTTRSHLTDFLQLVLASMSPDSLIRSGGCGNKSVILVTGQASAYVFPSAGTRLWDTCASEAVVKAAGGQFTNSFGEDIVYDASSGDYQNHDGVLATMKNHEKYVLNRKTHAIPPL